MRIFGACENCQDAFCRHQIGCEFKAGTSEVRSFLKVICAKCGWSKKYYHDEQVKMAFEQEFEKENMSSGV